MGSRWFNTAVVLVWLTTGTWLVVAKILPPLRRGEPPNYHSMYSLQATEAGLHVAWDMSLNGKELGYAVISLQKKNSDMTEVESRIHFEHVPLEELSPAWMRALMHTAVPPGDNFRMFVESHLVIDKLGYLSEFNSALRIDGLHDVIRIKGTVNGTLLKIVVRAGEVEYPFDTYLPGDALVSDELSPQLCLTGLRIGQEWTVPVFSPLRPPNNPVDVLQARVERREVLIWEGQGAAVNLVEYRADSGSALSSTSQPRARIWVRDDGAVLKQEVSILGSDLTFLRLSPERSDELAVRSKDEEPEGRLHMHRRGGFGGPLNANSNPANSNLSVPDTGPDPTEPVTSPPP
ncbi:MAG TPA: hypothetical protein VFE46_05895 [Pirellulales bacterium]|jgi:hypothetical protein|nr:hypothetical protein [Pirellulales bacterium]